MAGVAAEVVTPARDGSAAFVGLASGESMTAEAVVVATEGPVAAQLLSTRADASPSKPEGGVGTNCLYYR